MVNIYIYIIFIINISRSILANLFRVKKFEETHCQAFVDLVMQNRSADIIVIDKKKNLGLIR